MSILIKGVEMPKNCEECAIKSWDTEDYVCPFSGVSTLCISRQADCPLIPVPPHGRLIDADKIEYVQSENGHLDDCAYRYDINEMPTIIPASGGAEDE